MEKKKKLNKKVLTSLRNYRAITVKTLAIIICCSLWVKVSLNPNWHFYNIIIEFISLFILIIMGSLANIKNDFPIFQMRKMEFTKDFLYSIILSLTLLLIFILYKNIVDPNFINYIANLSFHDTCSLVIFLAPMFILIIYLIFIGFKLFYNENKTKKVKKYEESIEASLARFKSLTIKLIGITSIISCWYKIGLIKIYTISDVYIEIICIATIVILFIAGNIHNKLNIFYNNWITVNRTFICSILLPYLLVIIYCILQPEFLKIILNLSIMEIISIFVYMFPLFLFSSILFYLGNAKTKKAEKNKKNPLIESVIISFIITIIIALLLLCYIYTNILNSISLENLLQIIIVLIPLSVIIYLVLYSGIRYIHK